MPSSDPTRDRILTAAEALFSERGFAGASTRDIAAAAGVNQGLIAYHFGGKDPLFQEVVGRGLGELRAALAAEPERGLERLLTALAARGPLVRLLTHALIEPGPRRDWLTETQLAPLAADLRAILIRERPGSPALGEPVALLTIAAAAASLALFAPALEAALGQPLDRDRALRAQRELLLRAIHTDPLSSRGPWAPRSPR